MLLLTALLFNAPSCSSDAGPDSAEYPDHAQEPTKDDHAGHAHETPGDGHADLDGESGEDDHAGHTPGADADSHAGHTPGADADSHAGHAHHAGSDLDRPAAELFAAVCEHGMPAHRCDECRYEVGVACVPHDFIDEGLVGLVPVQEHSFQREIELTGEIRFDERKVAWVGARLPGVVHRVRVGLGEPVAPGQPLIEIDSAELAAAQAEYLDALAAQRLARRNHERQRELRAAEIASEREFLEAEQRFEAAAIRANSERQRLLRLGLTAGDIDALERAGLEGATGRLLVKAPFEGEVLTLEAVPGEHVEEGGELILVGDTRTLWVWVDLYESHLAAVGSVDDGEGPVAGVSVRAYPGEIFSGRVNFIGRTMDERTRTVEARITLKNPDGKLKPGMFAGVQLMIGAKGEGLAVPSAAVLSDEGRDFVFVHHQGDYFVRRPVVRGRAGDGVVEIVDGLMPGQTVVGSGAFLLKSDVLRSKMGEGCAH